MSNDSAAAGTPSSSTRIEPGTVRSTSRRRSASSGWSWTSWRAGCHKTADRGVPPPVPREAGPGRVVQHARRRLDQPAVGGPPAELVAVRELELSQHRRDMALDRLHRDVELARDLLVGVAPGDEPQDLALPGRELVELRIDGWRGRAGERVEHEPRESGGEHRVAAVDPADREGEVGRRDRLRDVSSGAGPDHRYFFYGDGEHRECQEAHVRMLRSEGFDNAGPVAIGEV